MVDDTTIGNQGLEVVPEEKVDYDYEDLVPKETEVDPTAKYHEAVKRGQEWERYAHGLKQQHQQQIEEYGRLIAGMRQGAQQAQRQEAQVDFYGPDGDVDTEGGGDAAVARQLRQSLGKMEQRLQEIERGTMGRIQQFESSVATRELDREINSALSEANRDGEIVSFQDIVWRLQSNNNLSASEAAKQAKNEILQRLGKSGFVRRRPKEAAAPAMARGYRMPKLPEPEKLPETMDDFSNQMAALRRAFEDEGM